MKEFHSPNMPIVNGSSQEPPLVDPRPVSQEANQPVRKSDPMSFASILSSSNPDSTAPIPAVTNGTSKPTDQPEMNHMKMETSESRIDTIKSEIRKSSLNATSVKHESMSNGQIHEVAKPIPLPRKTLTGPESDKVIKAMAEIDEAQFSDVEGPGFEDSKENYQRRRLKRRREQDEMEESKRKVSSFWLYEQNPPLIFLSTAPSSLSSRPDSESTRNPC